jgi:hypothetical protein
MLDVALWAIHFSAPVTPITYRYTVIYIVSQLSVLVGEWLSTTPGCCHLSASLPRSRILDPLYGAGTVPDYSVVIIPCLAPMSIALVFSLSLPAVYW